MALKSQRIQIPINAGIDQSDTPAYVEPPALLECENFYHKKVNALTKRYGVRSYPIVVDARKAQVTSWLVDPSEPLTACSIDRFIESDDGVVFASRGWLWAYTPDAYADFNDGSVPNCKRIGEIPDLQIRRSAVYSTDNTSSTGLQIVDVASVCNDADLICTTYLLHSVGSYYEWWVHVSSRSTGVVLSAERLLYSFTHSYVRPCAVAYDGGLVVTLLDTTDSVIKSYRYLTTDAEWSEITWPALSLHSPFGGGPYSPIWYDLCGTGTADVHIAFVVSTGAYSIEGLPDPVTFTDGLFVGTVDVNSVAMKYGAFPVDDHATRQVGCLTHVPMFSVAGNASGDYAVIWANSTSHKVLFHAYHDQTQVGVDFMTHLELASLSAHETKVALGVVAPDKQVDVLWNALWEREDTNLGAGGGYLNTVSSQTITATMTTTFQKREYYGSRIASNPWCQLGKSYAILVPNQPPYSDAGGVVSGAFFSDVPWIMTRTWSDQDTMDTDADEHNYQYPFGVWGYGTTVLTTQPYRLQGDPTTSNYVAFGAVVNTDPFLQFTGSTVLNLTFDPTGPDRYESASLPGGGAIFGCAQPWTFDGERAFESAFVMRPWSVSTTTASGGSLEDDSATPDASHYIRLVYEHTDAKGRVTRSAPSDVMAIATTASNKKIVVQVVPPFWSARKPKTTTIQVYMCRDGLSFALAGMEPVVTYNPGDAALCVVITISGEPSAIPPVAPALYTNDGTVESGYPQLAAHLTRWNNRIWLADENRISYSQRFVDGEAPSFPNTFTESVDAQVTAICHMDDRMLMWNLDAIAYRSGDGPKENGQESSFTEWNYFTHEVGCANPRSVLHTVPGIFFQSRRYLEFMDNSCNVTHLLSIEDLLHASPVQGSGQSIVGGISLVRDHQARFLYYDASYQLKVLAVDYMRMTWSRWSGAWTWAGSGSTYRGDIVLHADTVYMADSAGRLYVEDTAAQYDSYWYSAGTSIRRHINWSIKTPWIKIDGLQGVQRVWTSELMFRCAPWVGDSGPAPLFGLTLAVDVDYAERPEVHDAVGIMELTELRNPDGLTYLTVGHIEQLCRGYQLQLSSTDSSDYSNVPSPTGVYELLGLWSELGVSPGTGRGRAESKI